MANQKKKSARCGRSLPEPPHREDPQDSSKFFERLASYVAQKQLNKSQARTKILEVMLGFKHHFTAQELTSAVRDTHPTLGAATIYRNLPVFVDAGLLHESLADESGQQLYELDDEGHHDHIVCVDCGAILEFHDSTIEERQTSILKDASFREVRHRHVIYAKCSYRPN